jgi:hypothetical protein
VLLRFTDHRGEWSVAGFMTTSLPKQFTAPATQARVSPVVQLWAITMQFTVMRQVQ